VYVFMCSFVCMHTYIFMHVCVCLCTHTFVCAHMHVWTCMYVCIYLCMYVSIYVCMHARCARVHACVKCKFVEEIPPTPHWFLPPFPRVLGRNGMIIVYITLTGVLLSAAIMYVVASVRFRFVNTRGPVSSLSCIANEFSTLRNPRSASLEME